MLKKNGQKINNILLSMSDGTVSLEGGIIDDDTKVIKPSKTYGDTSKNSKSKKDDVMDQPTFFDIIDSEIGDKNKK